jgi:hypothetical protein
MKKLLLLGALCLTALSVPTGEASAWFGCFGCRRNSGYAVYYYYRPYNAFDPNCCGAAGHYHPGLCHGRDCVPWCPPGLPSCFGDPCCEPGMSCMNSGCCDAGSLPPTMPSTPAPPPAAPSGPAFTPPMPAPVPATSQMYYYPMPVAQNPISTAAYQPGYYPAPYAGYYPTYPMGYYPVMPAAYPAPSAPWGMPGYGR